MRRTESNLTAHELKIIQHLADGLLHREIAVQVGCAKKTVDSHVCRAMAAIKARNGTHLVAECIRKGWLE